MGLLVKHPDGESVGCLGPLLTKEGLVPYHGYPSCQEANGSMPISPTHCQSPISCIVLNELRGEGAVTSILYLYMTETLNNRLNTVSP